MPDIFSFSVPASFPPAILWIIFIIVAVVWSIASGIMWFHWSAYGSQTKRVVRIKRVYLIGSLILLLLAMSFIFSL